MDESELLNSGTQEVAPQEEPSHVEAQAEQQTAKSNQPDGVVEDKNWRAFRDRQKELERELRIQKELNERLLQTAYQPPQAEKPEVDELDSIADDEFIPKGKVKALVQKQAQRIAQEVAQRETEKVIQKREDSQFLDRLKRNYSDFDDVVNSDTVALLEQTDPELATTIAELKDPYKIGIQTYKYIKAMNLAASVPEARQKKEVTKKLAENEKTVQSPQVFDKRPMAQAFRMTEKEKAALYEEMIGYASMAS